MELYADYVDSANIALARLELWKRKWMSVSIIIIIIPFIYQIFVYLSS